MCVIWEILSINEWLEYKYKKLPKRENKLKQSNITTQFMWLEKKTSHTIR